MEEEIKEVVEQAETEIKKDVQENDEDLKGEDIYVENDPADLERMLGIAPEEKEDEEENKENISSEESEVEETPIEDSKEEEEHGDVEVEIVERKPVMLSDFMVEDKDSFTYLSKNKDSYHVCALPLDDKKLCRQAVRSPNYIFRYPRFLLKDKVLGFIQSNQDCLRYVVYFPEYSLYFEVDEDYMKPYSESFKDYFEDLVTRVRPRNMNIVHYDDSITFNSLKVIETGIIEVSTEEGKKTLLLNNPNISFHNVLDYIRELSDQGEETLTLKFLPEFFIEI